MFCRHGTFRHEVHLSSTEQDGKVFVMTAANINPLAELGECRRIGYVVKQNRSIRAFRVGGHRVPELINITQVPNLQCDFLSPKLNYFTVKFNPYIQTSVPENRMGVSLKECSFPNAKIPGTENFECRFLFEHLRLVTNLIYLELPPLACFFHLVLLFKAVEVYAGVIFVESSLRS